MKVNNRKTCPKVLDNQLNLLQEIFILLAFKRQEEQGQLQAKEKTGLLTLEHLGTQEELNLLPSEREHKLPTKQLLLQINLK